MTYRNCAVLPLAFALATPTFALTYTITDLGSLGNSSIAVGVNSSGQTAGWSSPTPSSSDLRATFYNGSSMQVVSGFQSTANGLNDAGHVIGESRFSSGGARRAFMYDGTSIIDLGVNDGIRSAATGINNSGTIVGTINLTQSTTAGFVYSGSTYQYLPTLGGTDVSASSISNTGYIAGAAETASGQSVAFVYDGTTMVNLGANGRVSSSALAVNDFGKAVGFTVDSNQETHAFIYDGTQLVEMGFALGNSNARGINGNGYVVGDFINVDTRNAFVYDGSTVMNLNDHMDASGAGWTLVEAWDINDSGQIVGFANVNGEGRAFLATPDAVPEPATMTILGLGALAVFRRKQKS